MLNLQACASRRQWWKVQDPVAIKRENKAQNPEAVDSCYQGDGKWLLEVACNNKKSNNVCRSVIVADLNMVLVCMLVA